MTMRKIRIATLGVVGLLPWLLGGCSIQKIALGTMGDIFDTASLAVEEEKDLEIARPAVMTTAKLMEGFVKGAPGDVTLNTLSSKALFLTSFAFVESEFEALQFKDPSRAGTYKRRASELYRRAFSYGDRLISGDCGLESFQAASLDAFKACVGGMGSGDARLMFWTGFSWAKLIFLNMDDPNQLGQLPKLVTLMTRVEELDAEIEYGFVHVFFGIYYASRSKTLGGDPAKARDAFERAAKLNNGKNLLVNLFKAQFLARQTLDEEMFEKELRYVLEFNKDHPANLGLINAVSKERAKVLLAQKGELF